MMMTMMIITMTLVQVRETPYWLVEHSLEKEARSALQWSVSEITKLNHLFWTIGNISFRNTCQDGLVWY